jgi:crotonobetainyl-CoA:carnitine CoA-transferase CaiB-like acyl-CoA transferase
MALGMLAALYRQRVTGEGCWIDSSQAEAGLYLTGTAVLDHSANGRSWARYGNRSPHLPAAPHGIFRVGGEDRWVAISCFDDEQWRGLLGVLDGGATWGEDERFATLDDRLAHQDALEELVAGATAGWEPYSLMEALQAAGVPAGVCQTAEDRCDRDPQLEHAGWTVELDQRDIGRWPVKEIPVHLSDTPTHVGGPFDRSGPSYAQDNELVYGKLLGLSARELLELETEGVI